MKTKEYTFGKFVRDAILTILTGGIWLFFIIGYQFVKILIALFNRLMGKLNNYNH